MLEPDKFAQMGYRLIVVGFVLTILYGLYISSNGLSSSAWVVTFLSLGQSLVLVGAIFAAAGHITEHLRPAKTQP